MKKGLSAIVIMIVLLFCACSEPQITVPAASNEYVGQNVDTVLAALSSAGFEIIETEAVDDLTSTSAIEDGTVINVEIDGNITFDKGQCFSHNAAILIRYHRIPRIKNPVQGKNISSMNYIEVAKQLFEAGFTNVVTDEVYDLDPDSVGNTFQTTVQMQGNISLEQMEEIPFDSNILVTGHYPFKKYAVSIALDCEENWFFSKYDISFILGEETPIHLDHGQSGTFSFSLPAGSYILRFENEKNSEIYGATSIQVSCDMEASYHLQCHSDSVKINERELSYSNKPNSTDVFVNYSSQFYLRKNYKECIQQLKSQGFTNMGLSQILCKL